MKLLSRETNIYHLNVNKRHDKCALKASMNQQIVSSSSVERLFTFHAFSFERVHGKRDDIEVNFDMSFDVSLADMIKL